MKKSLLYPALVSTVGNYEQGFDLIHPERKIILDGLTFFLTRKLKDGGTAQLTFICTHNSRRSLMAQVWAQALVAQYGIDGVYCYSGGTEATAFNFSAQQAMIETGFAIQRDDDERNPRCAVRFSSEAPPIIAFSKKYDEGGNPKRDFTAIMTCSQADENCPFISGATERFSITYEDPKDFDGSPLEAQQYRARLHQIGAEMAYVFSGIAN